jgi:hypothetical protein
VRRHGCGAIRQGNTAKVRAPAECSVPRTNVNTVIFDNLKIGQVRSPLSGRDVRLIIFDLGLAGRPRGLRCLNVEQPRIVIWCAVEAGGALIEEPASQRGVWGSNGVHCLMRDFLWPMFHNADSQWWQRGLVSVRSRETTPKKLRNLR